jgi:hypothetical protein
MVAAGKPSKQTQNGMFFDKNTCEMSKMAQCPEPKKPATG